MSIVDHLPAIRAGRTVHIVEPPSRNQTTGHREDEAGLRGHSVGEDYPYRVVGYGDGSWGVQRNGCRQQLTGMNCEGAHAIARILKQKENRNG